MKHEHYEVFVEIFKNHVFSPLLWFHNWKCGGFYKPQIFTVVKKNYAL